MPIKNNYLFNFSVSHSGGGYKRLYAYSKFFNAKGGAYFILHPNCKNIALEFKKNKYFFAKQSSLNRLLNDCFYLSDIINNIESLRFYYSYGIPIYCKIANVNWFHISNVLPLASEGIPISLFDCIKMRFLGNRIRANFLNADVISAESNYSLSLINNKFKEKLFLSVNGSNDELAFFKEENLKNKIDIAVILGTYKYKSILESFYIFKMLQETQCPNLKLIIIGDLNNIPKNIANHKDVIVKGFISRKDLINYLKKAKYYISTTYIENSYNAASEGIFLADESYISDIGPHRELLLGMPFNKIFIKNISRFILHVKKKNITSVNTKVWETIINEMLVKFKQLNIIRK